MYNARKTYDQFKIHDTNEYKIPFSYMTNMLAGQDPDQLLFTALSRVPMLSSLAFVQPMDKSRLKLVWNQKDIKEREAWKAQKWPPLRTLN